MLLELCIRDLALIEKADLSFVAGLNVVTGETGAGKSLIVGALNGLLGERVKGGAGSWVREGATRARVEARFSLGEPTLRRAVEDCLRGRLPELLEEGERDEIVVGRTLTADGRSRAHIDQRPVALRDFKVLTGLLLDIHGQNDHQALLQPVEQLRLLDLFADLEPKVRRYAAQREAWIDWVNKAQQDSSARAERRDRLDLARYQLAELERAAVSAGEGVELREERELLRNAATVQAELGGLVDELYERDGSTLASVRSAERTVARWAKISPRLAGCVEALLAAQAHLDEAVTVLSSVVAEVESDPTRLEVVEERLAEIERLEHKYARPADELAPLATELGQRVQRLEAEEEEASGLSGRVAEARTALERASRALTRSRKACRASLVDAVMGTLAELGLERAQFDLLIEERAIEERSAEERPSEGGSVDWEQDRRRFGPRGADRVEFRLAANPGEPARPLAQVASGGEAARIMLALRSVLAACDRGRTLVFDEVDAGVGGRLGPAVGRHLKTVGQGHQVLVVTHLPAIAAAADHHLRVAKTTRGKRTSTSVDVLSGEARVAEVAAMIAGSGEAATARAEASRLLAP